MYDNLLSLTFIGTLFVAFRFSYLEISGKGGSTEKIFLGLVLIFLSLSSFIFSSLKEESFQNNLSKQRSYDEYKKYNESGLNIVGDCLTNQSTPYPCLSEIAQRMDYFSPITTFGYDDGALQVDCKREFVLDGIIKDYPSFPFAYVFKAGCRQKADKPEWRESAMKAQEILSYTAKSEGTHLDHKKWLNIVEKSLAGEEPILSGVGYLCDYKNGGRGPCENADSNGGLK